jgi:predicted 2-oxoglutarate/Fe(II)-dependent dioxygenase YbiX
VERFAGIEIPAPVLVIPNVFEPELCQHLIGLYETHGGEESGFMREIDGKTVAVHDPGHKRRKDYTIEDEGLRRQIQHRIHRRVNPEIEKVHFFRPTRMERYIVSCYAAEDGGHFRAHRDNTTKGTAHRRYAVSINLNSDFEVGEVSFPEYSPRSYKAPPGGAVVFSCPLLHAVSRVT